MSRAIDLAGQVFGNLTVLAKDGVNAYGDTYWSCHCACGVLRRVLGSNLRRGLSRSCGCAERQAKHPLQIGQRFGAWTVIGDAPALGSRARRAWQCRCDCGVVRNVKVEKLVAHLSLSCGCLQKNQTGVESPAYKHGLVDSTAYKSWAGMMQRCYNEKNTQYAYYGGRGIAVHSSWHTFQRFFSDMGEKPEGLTLERKDVNGDYSLENCCWATNTAQARNKRNNRKLTYQGATRTIAEWAEHLGMKYNTLHERLRRGWSVEQSLMGG